LLGGFPVCAGDDGVLRRRRKVGTPAQDSVSARESNLGLLHVWVEREGGRPVTGLKREDFDVHEGPDPREIAFFVEQAGDAVSPSSIVLAVDAGGLRGAKLQELKGSLWRFLSEVPAAAHVAMVASSGGIVELCALGAARDAVRTAVGQLKRAPESHLGAALLHSLSILERATHRRRVLIVSSAVDVRENAKLVRKLSRAARRSPVVVYVVALHSRSGGLAHTLLHRLAVETGGRMFLAARPGQIDRSFSDIARELRYHYVLGYVTPRPETRPRFHPVRVTARVNAEAPCEVRTRKGFLR
jgi:VWFA-related protein